MYLKNIEIQGFKSFARKIVFDFHEGITGIVGPNGSGKSNVADAVRWVFGEQKVKQLRGGSMQDVIFSGTELRKPLSFASVSITLDNSDHQLAIDYEEVTITRKLFRSGESEYGINGSTCRLKDINELFYDTGIGKEGYSIIGQGQIDKILSGKPEERRELFDEAAGIVKFKKRKNMSVKKLDDERQNLIRVNDILSEIEKQIGPLEKQSAIAKEFLAKKEELKIYDINMFLLEAEKLKIQLVEIDQNIDTVQNDYNNAQKMHESMKEEYEEAEDEIDEIDSNIEKLKHQLNETNILKQQLEGKIAVLNEQINTVKMNDEHIGKRAIVIQEELAEREGQKENLTNELDEIAQKLADENSKANAAKEKLTGLQENLAEKNSKGELLKQEIIDLLNDRASTKAKIQRFDTMLEQGNIRKTQINRRLIEIQTDKVDCQLILDGLQDEKTKMEQTVSSYQNQMLSIEKEIEEMHTAIASKVQEQKNAQTSYH
ncbi:MAG: AAA family ATPase, partial [Eubacteriales bacterium]